MMRPYLGCLAMAVLVLVLAAASNPRGESFDDGRAIVPVEMLAERANQVLGLWASDIVTLDVDGTPTLPIVVTLPIAGKLLTLNLTPHSVRAPGYNILMQIEDGSYVAIEPAPVRTLRGFVFGVTDAKVAGSMEEEGLIARIHLPNGQEYWIEPAAPRVAGASANQYIVYNQADVIPLGGTCAAQEVWRRRPRVEFGASSATGGGACGTEICLAELACDADFEFFEAMGSVAGVESRINSIINLVNAQYEDDVQITHEITTIIVRTGEPDPYSSTDSSTLLNQFRSHWNANHGNIQRDAAELFTGKNLQGNIIGIAYVGTLCTTFGYSVVENNYNGINGNFSCKTDLTAHELGHNWNADHCNCLNPNYTMNSSITCVNRFHPTDTIPEIQSFRDSRSCLDGLACETAADCDDGNLCTDDFCNAPVCAHINNTISCNDGDLCTLNDACDSGSCAGDPIVCDDGDPCTNDSCSVGLCLFNLIECNDFNACTDDGCIDGDCRFTSNTNTCNDSNPCTVDDTCTGGQCFGGPMDCDDGDPCTIDSCFLGACHNSTIICNDNDPCTDDACVGGTCQFTNNQNLCDDFDACTVDDRCSGGRCVGEPLDCDDGNPCTDDACNLFGDCENTPNAAPCDDGDLCTLGDACSSGECRSGAPTDCDDGNPCTDEFCASGGCITTNNQKSCDDGMGCTANDRCIDGVCTGDLLNCNDGNPCTDDACDPEQGLCVNTPNSNPCDDGDPCTEDDSCATGLCAGTRFVFGDVNRSGLVDLFDILCVLDGFEGRFNDCSLKRNDLVGAQGACGGDGQIDLADIIAVLNSFEGTQNCCAQGR